MLVFERLPFTFSILKLQDYLFNTVKQIGKPICPIEPNFGGWSITSETGHWQDGWREANKHVMLPEKYNKPTELYTGYIVDVIQFIEQQGLEPTKIRISVIPPNGKSSIHRDYPPSLWRARLHIPLLTNEQCCHIIYNKDLTEETKFHMPADGSAYMFWVNLRHQYMNMSNKNRYHLVMDVKDTKGITENFKCTK
jgi:hypothetical protein